MSKWTQTGRFRVMVHSFVDTATRYAMVLAVLLFAEGVVAEVVQIGPSQDNTLYENANGAVSNGAGDHLFAGKTFELADRIRRGLIVFDVQGNIPAGATITSVTLRLNMSRTNTGVQPVAVHRLSADWGEGTSHADGEEGRGADATPGDATWLHGIFDTQFWSSPGGDFMAAGSASIPVNADGFYTWGSTPEMVADVQAWRDNPSENYGWILIGNEASTLTAKRFDSKDNIDPAVRPVLTVAYERAVPAVPAASPWGLAILALLLLVLRKLWHPSVARA